MIKTTKAGKPMNSSKSKLGTKSHSKHLPKEVKQDFTSDSQPLHVTKKELKTRLKKKMGKFEIEKLIDEYIQASLNPLPDMTVMAQLAQKHRAATLLDVRFRLEPEQYDALAEYFKDDGQPGTSLVKKAIQEFIL